MTHSTAYFKMPFYLADTTLPLYERVLYAYLLNGSQVFPENYTPTLTGIAHHLGVTKTIARKVLNSLVEKHLVAQAEDGITTVNSITERDDLFI